MASSPVRENVEAIHIISNGKSYYAIQADNGRYYNRQGETLGRGFARYPLQRQVRGFLAV